MMILPNIYDRKQILKRKKIKISLSKILTKKQQLSNNKILISQKIKERGF
jgi:hypothetical protein